MEGEGYFLFLSAQGKGFYEGVLYYCVLKFYVGEVELAAFYCLKDQLLQVSYFYFVFPLVLRKLGSDLVSALFGIPICLQLGHPELNKPVIDVVSIFDLHIDRKPLL